MADLQRDTRCSDSAPNGDVEEQSPLLPSSDPCRRELRILLRIFTPGSYSNLLLVFIPLGITFGIQNRAPELIFWFNLLAIIPLSKLNLRKLRKLSCMLGPLGGGFLHAILDNAPLLIVCMIHWALIYNQNLVDTDQLLGRHRCHPTRRSPYRTILRSWECLGQSSSCKPYLSPPSI